MKLYDNKFDVKNKGSRIMDMDKLNEGQTYILDMHGNIKCGPLIKKTLSDLVNSTNYYGIYFRVGMATYDRINMKDQVYHYHLQVHLNLSITPICIYEYNLAGNLQEQIKTWRYYKKTINNLCKN